MNNAYGQYKKARNASWQVLIDNNICELPVNIVKIANNNNITILKNSNVHELQNNEIGVSIYDGIDWFIIYDDTIESTGRKRFTIAHELGHIFLGHSILAGYHKRAFDISKPQVETEADIFASRLLSPACVLWGLNIRSANEIAEVCNISLQAAKIREKRMNVLYERNSFLISSLERKVYLQFENYIKNNAKR